MNEHKIDLPRAVWRTSSYSNGNGGACVEISDLNGGHHAVRDSKNPTGAVLTVTLAGWTAFVAGVCADEFG